MQLDSEVVLPSGTFAHIRAILVSDVCAMHGYTGLAATAMLASLVATLDGEPVSLREVLAMEYAEAAPIFHAIGVQLCAANKTADGVA